MFLYFIFLFYHVFLDFATGLLFSKLKLLGKEVIGMKIIKNLNKKFSSIVACLVLMATIVNVNTACNFVWHQPKMPENAKKLRKF